MKITKASKNCVDLICKYESFQPKPYMCPANVPTIGYGTTRYPNGNKVSLSDKPITKAQALDYLAFDLSKFEKDVDALCTDLLNQNQFDALVSFTYNLGAGSLRSSTLLKKVNNNPNDKTIALEFDKWVYANGKKLQGLINRRKEESKLYFK